MFLPVEDIELPAVVRRVTNAQDRRARRTVSSLADFASVKELGCRKRVPADEDPSDLTNGEA